MTPAVVVIGPTAVCGPGTVDAALSAVALDGIDDDLVLVDDRPVPIDQMWADVMRAVLGGRCDGVVVVCPSWWSAARVERVGRAVRHWSTDVTVRRRVDVTVSDATTSSATVVEVAQDVVVIHGGAQRHAVARVGATADVVGAVVAGVDGLGAVVVDVPTGLEAFGAELVRALRRRHAVTVVGDRSVARAAHAQPDGRAAHSPAWRRRMTPRAAVLAGAVVSAAALTAAAVGIGGGPPATTDPQDSTWLVEGRVAVEIPARWTVERITSGPGSARVQVVSPTEAFAAIQVTQSRVPVDQTLDATAEALRLALAAEPDGVFVDFTAVDRRAERPVVTYREVRTDHHVAWAVMVDRGVRIAIGCQAAPTGGDSERFCDRAIRSAHAVL